ncbi:MAG: hypothetical protein BMS9Abin37_2130 [Acidobacteriota bacterium]|nr:MAG: hypothetical protein BMS9Abin37_2130 [Acidobacteriota bacterium]
MIRALAFGLAFTFAGPGSIGLSQEAASTARELGELEHTPASCMDSEAFPLIEARASTTTLARGLTGLTIRFKVEDDDGWYETSFRSTTGTTFQAALPKPLPDVGRVVYYFTSAGRRTPDYLVPVLIGGCPGARAAPSDLADDIRVRRTSDDQSQFPTGFSTDGIRAGGSISGMTLGIVAAAAGGAGVAALVISGDEAPPGNGGGGPSNPEVIRACFTPNPIPDIASGETIVFDASCTTPATVTAYQWDFGDGATAQGSSVEHLFRPGNVYSVTLTASEGSRSDTISRLVHVIATPSACFITNPDPPRVAVNEPINFNAECTEGDRDGGGTTITRYEWDFGDGRPGAEGVFVLRRFPAPDIYGVRLTVTNDDGIQDRNTQFIVVESRATTSREPTLRAIDVTFTSELEFPEGSEAPRAQLSINDAGSVTTTATQRLRIRARGGENFVEGRLLAEASGPGRWRFDFNGTASFVAGSLRVDSGQVLAVDSHSVVFRVTGKPGPFVRFRFRLGK